MGSKNPGVVARNICRNYGKHRLRWLLDGFSKNRNMQEMANTMGVSRERIRQYKDALGQQVSFYMPFPEIDAISKEGTFELCGQVFEPEDVQRILSKLCYIAEIEEIAGMPAEPDWDWLKAHSIGLEDCCSNCGASFEVATIIEDVCPDCGQRGFMGSAIVFTHAAPLDRMTLP